MPRRFPFCLTITILLALLAPLRAETDEEVAARQTALEVAGAFANDGFKLRDGHWSGMLAPNETAVVSVDLYAGNDYWFSAGATAKAKKISVEVFDENGAAVSTEKYNSGTKAAAGFSVNSSGQYFVRLRLESEEPAGVCFIYSYK